MLCISLFPETSLRSLCTNYSISAYERHAINTSLQYEESIESPKNKRNRPPTDNEAANTPKHNGTSQNKNKSPHGPAQKYV